MCALQKEKETQQRAGKGLAGGKNARRRAKQATGSSSQTAAGTAGAGLPGAVTPPIATAADALQQLRQPGSGAATADQAAGAPHTAETRMCCPLTNKVLASRPHLWF